MAWTIHKDFNTKDGDCAMPWDKATRDHYTRSMDHYESNGSDCGVGACGAISTGGKRTGTAPYDRSSYKLQRYSIYSYDRLPVACVAAMFSAIYDVAASFHQMA